MEKEAAGRHLYTVLKTLFKNPFLMKKILHFACAATLFFSAASCSKSDTKTSTPTPAPLISPPLTVHAERTLGWGKGRASNDAYLSVSMGGGQIKTWRSVGINDTAVQNKVDVVFPGDWGGNGGPITICNPVETGGGGAAYEYCTDWLRKKGTRFVFLPGTFQRAQFDSTTTVAQVAKIFAGSTAGSWDRDTKQGTAFAIQTEEGIYAIAYITSVLGTYGSTGATVKLILKVQP